MYDTELTPPISPSLGPLSPPLPPSNQGTHPPGPAGECPCISSLKFLGSRILKDGTNSKKEMQGIQTISKKGENTQLTSSFLAPLLLLSRPSSFHSLFISILPYRQASLSQASAVTTLLRHKTDLLFPFLSFLPLYTFFLSLGLVFTNFCVCPPPKTEKIGNMNDFVVQ